MISSYVINNYQGIIILLSCFTNAASIALECFQRHLMFYTCNYNIRVTHRNGAIAIFFTRIRSTEGSSADCSLFILSLHALALHLAVKILLQIFLYEDLSTLALHTSVGWLPSRMPVICTLLSNQYY